MAKAVLIIDMPKSCNECPLCFNGNYGEWDFCAATGHLDEFGDIDCEEVTEKIRKKGSRPDWCPLKELPEKDSNDEEFDEYGDGFTAGWNSFRRKIVEGDKGVYE